MRIDEKLVTDAFKTDKESHITIDQEICRSKCKAKHCLSVCPGHLYTFDEAKNEILVEYAGCLECGTCLIACPHASLTWTYPRGDYGVQYRYG